MGYRDLESFRAIKLLSRRLGMPLQGGVLLNGHSSEVGGEQIYALHQLENYYHSLPDDDEIQLEYDRFIPGLRREIKAHKQA